MTDLHARILAVQLTHLCDSYEQDMGQCPCGFESSTLSEWAAHVTDALLGELGRYEYAVATADMEFFYMYADERSELDGLDLHPGEQIVRRHVTEWETE